MGRFSNGLFFLAHRIAILGSTGSIGCGTFDVVRHLGSSYRVTALSTHSRIDELFEQAMILRPSVVAITGACDHDIVAARFGSIGCQVLFGQDGLVDIASHEQVDCVVSAVVGAAGLPPAMAAISAGKRLLLANKESLVMAGSILMPEVARRGGTLLPIDSEHSAIFQAMRAGRRSEIKRVILTASGGPFREWSTERMHQATPADALKHPTWKMGKKITIDSATMFNKAAEIIEAVWLFDLHPSQVEVVIHPESVVHSMVEFVDGSTIAQLSPPDMRTPIQYALTYPDRATGIGRCMDFTQSFSLQFAPPDVVKWPALRLAYEVCEKRGTLGAVMNASNEVAVEAFLSDKIRFGEICEVVEHTMSAHIIEPTPTLADVLKADHWARTTAAEYVEKCITADKRR